jgi:UDP:flavonoid glycosyltransferase YjiC (YdhE family)
VPLSRIVAGSRLVVHHGGNGLASAMLVAGVPQVVLDTDIEKALTARALAGAGAAARLRFDLKPAPREVADIIVAAFENDAMRERAARLAPTLAPYLTPPPEEGVADVCEETAM